MKILVGSEKGGCGKSTTAVNICAELTMLKKDVIIVDADRQSTSSNWINDRSETNLNTVHCAQKHDNIRETINDFDKRYDYVVIDAAGRDSKELRTGMTATDILVIPFRPSQPDLDTLPKMQELISLARDFNKNLKAYGLLTMVPTNPVIKERKEAEEYLESLSGEKIQLLETVLCDRKIYRDSMSNGHGVVELDNQKAKKEIKNLVQELIL
jgi:chromosome partitioning protein